MLELVETQESLLVNRIKHIHLKDGSMHFILHLNEDLDDDLLMDIIDLIEC